jgi:simple sugar transport system permease protein
MRLEARGALSPALAVAAPFAAVAATLVVAALFVAWAGAPVGRTYALIFEGGFGSQFAWSETLTRATPLMLTGLAAAIAFRAHLYNIGAEGQLYAGALAAVAVGGLHGGTGFDLPIPLLYAAMLGAAMLAGAILMALPAFAKTRFGVDEVVTTLLLNFIVLLFVSMMLDGPMKDPTAMGWPQSVALREELELPKLVERTRVHAGLLIAIALCALAWAAMRLTTFGFEVRAVGANARAARFAGVPVTRTLMLVALASGAAAGLAGAIEVAGPQRLRDARHVARLRLHRHRHRDARGLNPLGVIAAAVFVAGILVGADSMSRAVAVPTYIADVIVAFALIAMLVATLAVRYRVRWH